MGALMGGVLGILFGLIPVAIGVFFIWVALRIVDELTAIREQLWQITDRLPRASAARIKNGSEP
jgi:hypothetical protein